MVVRRGQLLRSGAVTRAFNQLSTQSTPLTACWQQLWERPDLTLRLWAVHSQPQYWAHQDRYLQTPDTLVLMPETMGRLMLGMALGNNQYPGLTGLEHAILHRACQQLSRQANLPLGQSPAQLTTPHWFSYWLVNNRDGFLGQLCIVWPKALVQRLPWPPEPPPNEPLPWFNGIRVQARIQAGQTYLPLNSLPQLEPGDVLVLDRSQQDTLQLYTPEGPLRFATTMSNHLPHYPAMSSADTPDWNHLMVELTAEFEPFLLPLGEVRAMSEGLLVELDDLAHNTLFIHSQGTRIAQGKLVVVGERFAVRIDQVLGQALAEDEPTQNKPSQSTRHETDKSTDNNDDDDIVDDDDTSSSDDELEQAFDDEEEQEQW